MHAGKHWEDAHKAKCTLELWAGWRSYFAGMMRMLEGLGTFGGVTVGKHVRCQAVLCREDLPEILQPPPPAHSFDRSILLVAIYNLKEQHAAASAIVRKTYLVCNSKGH